jgi:hypothetical protein
MHDLDREHRLHKVVAVSGFLFALLILPVAQFILKDGRELAQRESGSVAGVSTDTSVTNASVIDPVTCSATREQELKELQAWSEVRIGVLDREYATTVAPYEAAIPVLTGDTVATEKQALEGLISEAQQSYETKRDQVVTAVDAQVKEISSRDCGSAAASELPSQE